MTTPTTNPAIFKAARKPSPLASCAHHEQTPEIQVISNVCECDFGVVSGRRQQVVTIHRPSTVDSDTLAAH
jgi:hypothetical protein